MSLWDGIFGRRSVKLTDPVSSWGLNLGSYANKAVTPDSAMSLSAAWACVRLNARTVASLPLKVYERTAANNRRPADDHPLYGLLHDSPNADQTAFEFWEGQIAALNLRGAAYAEKVWSGPRLVALNPINPDLVTAYRHKASGARRYKISFPDGAQDWGEDRVFHLRGFGAGGLNGLSPVAYGRHAIANAMAADEVAGKTFANGLQLSGFIEMATGTVLKPEQRTQLVDLFAKFAGSSNSGKMMPLDPGMKFIPLGFTPEDAQLLETRNFNIEELCRWFGTFPILIGHAAAGQTMWGSGVEQINLAWLTLYLGPELQRLEQAIEKQLMSATDRQRFYVEHNVDALLRADTAARSALMSAQAQNGIKTRNELRAKDNDAPLPGGDVLTVQSNLVPLADLGKTPPRPTAPAPGEPI